MKLKLRYKILIIFILILIGLFLFSRYVDTKGLKVKEYNIINETIPQNFYGFKIIHISDLYYKSTTDKKDLKKITDKVKLIKPDIIVFTGDIFDKNIKYSDSDYKDLTNFFKSLNANIDKFIIKGDNDTSDKWENIINDSGFTNLNDTYKLVYYKGNDPILFIGISSNYKDNHIKDTFNKLDIKDNYKYSIILMHEADYIEDIEYTKYNLILAGHSLNGQIKLPFIGGVIKNKGAITYNDNYYDLDNTKIYVSSGIGTNSKYKFRLFNMPSINLYRLRNK